MVGPAKRTAKRMVDLALLVSKFQNRFHAEPRIFSAPGRVNLIGEHTDYNDGFVFPLAIDKRTFVAASKRTDRTIAVGSVNFEEEAEFSLDDPAADATGWARYVAGVAHVLDEIGIALTGASLLIWSEVPIGAGLSSSAALEIGIGIALLGLAGSQLDKLKLAFAAQRAEHIYAKSKTGLMDQLAALFGEPGHALLIDCRSFSIEPVALPAEQFAIVVCNTNVKHELSKSAYNERRSECERGVEILQRVLPQITALRDVSVDDFETHSAILPEPIRKRCRHVIYENQRTLEAVAALKSGEIQRAGELMLQSHVSLRDDYEVSCQELDLMVEIAMQQRGVPGARMTGGGFGGCTVNLVARDAVAQFIAAASDEYERQTGIAPAISVVQASAGATEVAECGARSC